MFRSRSNPFLRLKLTQCTVLFMFFLCTIFAIFFFQSWQNRRDEIFNELIIATNVLDRQITNANMVVDRILHQVTADCKKDSDIIDNVLLQFHSIQSINIMQGQSIICSSIERNIGVTKYKLNDKPLALITSRFTVPGQAIVLVSKSKDHFRVTATMQGSALLDVIQLLDMKHAFHINVKDRWLSDEGQLTSEPNHDNFIVHSKRFGYSVSANINAIEYGIMLVKYNAIIVWSIFLFSLLTALSYFRYGDNLVLRCAIRKGIYSKQFTPFAQAFVDPEGRVVGCEILMRWQYKQRLISPDQFIPTAERSGLIVPMTLDLLSDVYDTCLIHHKKLPNDFHLSVNITSLHLTAKYSQDLVESCLRITEHPSLKNIILVLELTEREIITNDANTKAIIKELHSHGIKLAIDDFGTGYSGLEILRDLKFDTLKIDKCFVDGYPDNSMSLALIDNILDLSQKLEVSVVAEGVETLEQSQYLSKRGVQLIQGYYYHKPEPLKQFLQTI
ncbi:EAL domain-containing protein [Vibrio sp. S11_S32]|uniref:EAL domain-containing protein n=1 Tax=Vibrio sp. S11_S32 TaxID=2720225 RepID=UPI001680157E|nr:EAL domain-containing protein [Vibrio sp. S11_S32]MBD1576895.1 EAL domain-containing protein [Vibrio sp. S11_S32]